MTAGVELEAGLHRGDQQVEQVGEALAVLALALGAAACLITWSGPMIAPSAKTAADDDRAMPPPCLESAQGSSSTMPTIAAIIASALAPR